MISSLQRVAHFIVVMYKPHYMVYGVLWVLALEGTAAVATAGPLPYRPGRDTVIRIVVVLLVLLYLRMVDEQKDLEYDRVHNPDRPLVTGAVSATELRASMAVLAAISVAASAFLSVGSVVVMCLTLLYGLFLWAAEAALPRVRDDIMLNLAVTYPVQLLVTAYVLVSAVDTGEVGSRWQAVAVVAVFAGAFLQFEFARKTSKVHAPSEHLYSNALGATGSATAIAVFAVVAVGAEVLLARPWQLDGAAAVFGWLPPVLLALPAVGLAKFLRTDRETFPLGPPVVFVLALYAVLIAQATLA
ncbi:hypothetical protein [Antrihabitans stalactiti]|uniref:hypothetical protein n=1 Tax=Antrihabitans stalactiti TaxID=2584121 RepID=UPI0030B81628